MSAMYLLRPSEHVFIKLKRLLEVLNALLEVRERNHFLYKASGVANQQIMEYLIDVVIAAALPRFMSTIDREMKAIAEQFRRRPSIVRNSVQRIYQMARKGQSNATIRPLMQFPLPRNCGIPSQFFSFQMAKCQGTSCRTDCIGSVKCFRLTWRPGRNVRVWVWTFPYILLTS